MKRGSAINRAKYPPYPIPFLYTYITLSPARGWAGGWAPSQAGPGAGAKPTTTISYNGLHRSVPIDSNLESGGYITRVG